jgi:hypothetical protein
VVKKIVVARAGDHGSYLIKEAKNKLPCMTIEIQNLGTHPGDSSVTWETVYWDMTRDEAKKKGVADVDSKIADMLDNFYGLNSKDNIAKDHLSVINTFRLVEKRSASCR